MAFLLATGRLIGLAFATEADVASSAFSFVCSTAGRFLGIGGRPPDALRSVPVDEFAEEAFRIAEAG